MQNWTALSLFVSVAAILVFTPGPNTLYIIARSIQQGRRAGIVSSCGVQVGTLIHVAIAALGLSALVISSVLAFNVVKYAGAAYLVYLGLKTLRRKETSEPTKALRHESLNGIFRQGVVVNVLNPKTALFFFAFLPQFIDPDWGAVAIQTVALGFILVFLGTTSDMLYALTAGSLGTWLRQNSAFLPIQRYFAGSVYLGLGALIVLE
jgi:threonine/homoserine/homoserine lactone efflux protein